MTTAPSIIKPTFNSAPMADGLRWPGGSGMLFEEKLDGQFHVEHLPGAIVVGELMRSGAFYAFDLLERHGQDVRKLPLWERGRELVTLGLPMPSTGNGGEFLEAVLARGGEGVVAKVLESPYGYPWTKCKRSQVFRVRVADLDPWNGAAVTVNSVTGEARGQIALRSRFDDVRVGSVLKVEAYGLTAKGLLREARLDKDTPESWLVSY